MTETDFTLPSLPSLSWLRVPTAVAFILLAGLPASAQSTVAAPVTPPVAQTQAAPAISPPMTAPAVASTSMAPAAAPVTASSTAPASTLATTTAPVPATDVTSAAQTVQPAVAAPTTSSATPTTSGTKGPSLSPWSMFLAADIVVKAIICILLAASLVTWTVFFAKTSELARERRRLMASLAVLGEARSLADVQDAPQFRLTSVAVLVQAARHELRLSDGSPSAAGIKERLATRLHEVEIEESREIRKGTGVLATIGSIGPFVGLLGTVWGIMNSFIGISQSGTTNLAVVAPGIAEALLATAIGLFAAIPAVAVYNHFSRATTRHLDLVSRAAAEIARLVSRDLDRQPVGRRTIPGPGAAAAE